MDEVWYEVAKRDPIIKGASKAAMPCFDITGTKIVALALIIVQRFLNRTFEQLYRQNIALTKSSAGTRPPIMT